jgi:thiosulfate/3-mercaptopyruvate sulfurtransferase
MNWRRTAIYFTTLLMAGCQSKPTKVYEARDIELKILAEKLARPIQFTEKTVLIDARSPFDFAMAHAPGAVNLQWTDFTARGPVPGLLKNDLFAEARRLAWMGIGPDTPVVVAGPGTKGHGDDGRLAWTLLYLGVRDVQLVDLDSLGLRYSNITPPPRASVPVWKPIVAKSILAGKKEVLSVATSKAYPNMHILDVRSVQEFTARTPKGYVLPDLRAVNIPWTEFFTRGGRPNAAIADRLRAIQIKPDDRVLVMDDIGVRSAAVTYALLALGYANAANFAGGWAELIVK